MISPSSAFHDIAVALTNTLRQAGHSVELFQDLSKVKEPIEKRLEKEKTEEFLGGDLALISDAEVFIIFGPHLFLETPNFQFPTGSILYQGEQYLAQVFKNPKYLAMLNNSRYIVWDYSVVNVEWLRNSAKIKRVEHVPFGFENCYSSKAASYNDSTKSIDILFVGWMKSPRRREIYQLFKQHFKNKYVLFLQGIYDDEWLSYVKKARIVLNLHFYADESPLESSRMIPLVANNAFVISEPSLSEAENDFFSKFVILSRKEDLLSLCSFFLNRDDLRTAFVKASSQRLKTQLSFEQVLKIRQQGRDFLD